MVSWLLFFFNDTATTEIYTLSLHAALPIFPVGLCLTDGNGALIEANPALAKHLGAALQRLRGKPLSVYLTAEDVRTFRTALRTLATGSNTEERLQEIGRASCRERV